MSAQWSNTFVEVRLVKGLRVALRGDEVAAKVGRDRRSQGLHRHKR